MSLGEGYLIDTTFRKLSNEFQFPIAAIHHAHETYLVPDVLRQTFGLAQI
jgi:hypothetical protein